MPAMLAWVPGPFEWVFIGSCCMGGAVLLACAIIVTVVIVRKSRPKSESDGKSGPFDGGASRP